MFKLVGLTGGIGSGKSTVAAMIREQGIPVMDADVIARQVVEPGLPAHADIAKTWPEVIASKASTQGIDRKRLAEIVFADPASKARLEAITHPRIREQARLEAASLAAAGHSLAFFEAALLVESGFYKQLDGVVLVVASEEIQIARVTARDGCSRESVLARVHAQSPVADKVAVADHVVDNSGSLENTRAQVLAVVHAIRTNAK